MIKENSTHQLKGFSEMFGKRVTDSGINSLGVISEDGLGVKVSLPRVEYRFLHNNIRIQGWKFEFTHQYICVRKYFCMHEGVY